MIPLIRKFVLILFRVIRVVARMLTFMVKLARAAEHIGTYNLTSKRVEKVEKSAVSDHLLQHDCTLDFDHFYILVSDTNV